MRYSLESSIPRRLSMDARGHWPFHRRHDNDMSIPVAVERDLAIGSRLTDIEEAAKDMATEFFWYFGYDVDHEKATTYLEYVKERIRLPQALSMTDTDESNE